MMYQPRRVLSMMIVATVFLLTAAFTIGGRAVAQDAGSPTAMAGMEVMHDHPAHIHSGTCATLGDVVFRVQPVTDIDAREMVHGIRGVRLLEGMRGEPPSDIEAVVEAVQRVSQLVGEFPEIRELDVNPFLVFEEGALAVDARIRVASAPSRG